MRWRGVIVWTWTGEGVEGLYRGRDNLNRSNGIYRIDRIVWLESPGVSFDRSEARTMRLSIIVLPK